MNPSEHDPDRDDPEHPDDARSAYVGFEFDDGGVVIYDPANHRAWIQSDVALALAGAA